MNHLHRELAHMSDEAWRRVDDEARAALEEFLAGRRLVDFSGPHGWDFASVATGEVEPLDVGDDTPVVAGLRAVRPLAELRAPFSIDREALREIDRGSRSVDLDAVVDAARAIAAVEDDLIFDGLASARVVGVVEGSSHEPISFDSAASVSEAVAAAITELQDAGIDGPYGLALGGDLWREVAGTNEGGYPLVKHLRLLVDEPVVRARTLTGGALVSQRGGDYELVVGGDLAVGFSPADGDAVHLYLTETVTFTNLEPAAAIPLRPSS